MPAKQPKRRRLWLNDGSCLRLRPEHRDHVWSYDFVFDRTHDGRRLRMLTVIDEFTRECLAIDVARSLTSEDVLARLSDLFIHRVTPDLIHSDNGPEFTAKRFREWLEKVGVKTLFIEPGSPGKTVTSSHSTESCAMSCSTSKSLTRSWKLEPPGSLASNQAEDERTRWDRRAAVTARKPDHFVSREITH